MQLTRSALLVGLLGSVLWVVTARAETGASTTTTLFAESGGDLNTTVITPSVNASVDIGEPVTVQAGWEADIVSGASVAVVDAPGDVDAITSATSYNDLRQTVGGSVTLRGDTTSLTAGYGYGFENDYRSHGLSLAARAELFERTMALEVSYARGFDQVCNLRQPRAQEAVDRGRLPNSEGCFDDGAEDRESLSLSLQTFQGAWTQAWSPVITTQVTLTAQVLNGYQGNPYRGVWLGRTSAQENHPENRARYAAGLGLRWWLEPINGAVRLFARAYRDTWDVQSFTGELAYTQMLGDALRVQGRGRYYVQGGAAFYSDDYTRFPRGQYFTGDRELSPFSSFTVGGRITYGLPPDDDGEVLGFLSSFDLALKADYVRYDFGDFRYGRVQVPNNNAFVATLSIEALF